MKTSVRDQVNALSTVDYFNLLATLMEDTPPAEADGPMVAKIAKLGIVPGKSFAFENLDPAVQAVLKDVPKQSFEKIMGHCKTAGENVNGWLFTTTTGLYGTDYLQRALVTAIGLGANRPQDAVVMLASRALLRCEQIRDAFRERRTSARRWFLVADDV